MVKNMGNDGDFLVGIFVTLCIFGIFEVTGLINGHTRDDIDYKYIEQAFEVCEDNEGLRKIEGETIGGHKFICNNGAVFTYKYLVEEIDG